MMWWPAVGAKAVHLSIPGLAAFAAADILHKISDASIALTFLFPLFIVAAAGVFTFRSKVANIYKENSQALGERLDLIEIEAKEQRDLKHDALNQVATLRAQLLLEQTKTDLTPLKSLLEEQAKALHEISEMLRHDRLD
jgi:hypothetical protein